MNDARRYAIWPYPRLRSRSHGVESQKLFHFQNLSISHPPFSVGAGKMTADSLTVSKFDRAGFLRSVLVFVSRDFELGKKLRRDFRKKFLSDLHLARRRSRPSVLHGAVFFTCFYVYVYLAKILGMCRLPASSRWTPSPYFSIYPTFAGCSGLALLWCERTKVRIPLWAVAGFS